MPRRPGSELVEPLLDWYRHAARDLPWRAADVDAWGVLVSEVMLQQTPVQRVRPAWTAWMARWPTPSTLAADPPGEAIRMWGKLGYPRRALRLHACARAITENFAGAVPSDVDDLLGLPGVGAYTARAVAVFAFGTRHPVVDINVRRVVARAVVGHGDAAAASTTRDLAAVEALLPAEANRAARFSIALMELGALVCVARAPAARSARSRTAAHGSLPARRSIRDPGHDRRPSPEPIARSADYCSTSRGPATNRSGAPLSTPSGPSPASALALWTA